MLDLPWKDIGMSLSETKDQMIEQLQTEYKQCLEEKAAIGFGCSLISLLLVDYIFGADATTFYYFLIYNQVP